MKKVIFFLLIFFLVGDIAMAGTATLNWNANSESDLAGYRVYYGTASRGAITHPDNGGYPAQNKVDVFGATTKVLDGLSEGLTYYFSVTAFDSSGNESNYSEEKTKYIPYPTCTSFTYGSWSVCTLGSQTRSVTSSVPANCTGGNPVLSQSCVVPGTTDVTCTSFTYTDWSTCSSQGVRTRSVATVSPENCTGGTRILQESCTPPVVSTGTGSSGGNTVATCSSWTYGAWTSCLNGKQSRQIISASPTNCSGGSPVVEQNCSATGNTATCSSWTYGAWSACINGKQTRTISLGSPENCTGGVPIVEQSCGGSVGAATGQTSKLDDDNDGLSNDLEIALGTNPQKADTDGDGFNDKVEISGGYNPNGTGKLIADEAFGAKQKGRIFIQVEGKGEAWYVNPVDGKKYYLGRPKDAFDIMRKFSLGVVHKFITDNNGKAYAAKYRGRILLDVEDKGKAYYIDIKDGLAYYLGSPANAFEVIRKRGSGIKNSDVVKINIGLIE